MVQSESVQYGRLNGVDVDRVFHDIPAPLVGLTVGEATAEATAQKEQAATKLLMVTAVH